MRTMFRHKAAIGSAALLLVVVLGTVSWAAPGDSPGIDPVGASVVRADDESAEAPGRGLTGRRGGGGFVPDRGVAPEEFKERMEQRRAQMERRREAALGRAREKMSAEDQATFDRLTAQAEQQRDALEQAREALVDTTRQIHSLIDEYLPLDPPLDGGGPWDRRGASSDDGSAGSM